MSVAGIDIGSSKSCIAVARKRGIDVLMNKTSKRVREAVHFQICWPVLARSDRKQASLLVSKLDYQRTLLR